MPVHPTPQRRRREWLDLTGTWAFAYDDADVGLARGWQDRPECFDRSIRVPFPPESAASGIHDPSFHPVAWYRRTFRLADVGGWRPGRRLLLHFGAVDYEARVWVDGALVGRHEGGHASFTLDVTDALRAGDGEHSIVVRAFDSPTDLAQPRGKQFWEPEPRRIWYHRTTGIWQPVWAEAVGDPHVEHLRWTPDPSRGLVGLHVELSREPAAQLALRVRLSLRGNPVADDTYVLRRRDLHREIGLEPFFVNLGRRELLWSARRPNLVDAELLLTDADGNVLDEIQGYLGVRSVETTDGLFILNGMPTYLRLVLSQGYWPDSHLAAPSHEAIQREVELIKMLGFNGVRNHQKVEDPRFLYECDRQGVLVWSEMASAYVFDERAVERFTREWLEVVRRDGSHPSIVTWVPFNESWGLPDLPNSGEQRAFVQAIYGLTKALDATRPVIGNDGWEHVVADIWGIHDYAMEGEALRERWGSTEAVERAIAGRPLHRAISLGDVPRAGQPIVLSEMGGISYHAEPGRPWFGYGTVGSSDELLARYDELVTAVLDSPGLAGFCYTQLTDTEQEANGLLDAARRPKVDPERLAAITSRVSRAIPGDLVSAAQEAGLETALGGPS